MDRSKSFRLLRKRKRILVIKPSPLKQNLVQHPANPISILQLNYSNQNLQSRPSTSFISSNSSKISELKSETFFNLKRFQLNKTEKFEQNEPKFSSLFHKTRNQEVIERIKSTFRLTLKRPNTQKPKTSQLVKSRFTQINQSCSSDDSFEVKGWDARYRDY